MMTGKQTGTAPALHTENLTIGYQVDKKEASVVAANLNIHLLPGEVVCLIGPNGAGKSTLIRSLTGLQPPLAGTVYLQSRDLHSLEPRELARNISIVTTERVNLGMFTGYTLTALGRYPYTDWQGHLRDRDKAAIENAIKSVGAESLAYRNVNEMSDGERQKIMIARALVQEAGIMVLDEPTAFLDLPRRVEVMSLLHNLSRDTGTSVLISTHELDLALRSADRIWLITGNGHFFSGAPEDCILSGAFERTFASDAVKFDKHHGSFHINTKKDIIIGLEGKGLIGYWTRRALEREGFSVIKGGGPRGGTTVVCGPDGGWVAAGPAGEWEFSSIYDMITKLRFELHEK